VAAVGIIRTSGLQSCVRVVRSPYLRGSPRGNRLELDQILDEVAAHPQATYVCTAGTDVAPDTSETRAARTRGLPHHHQTAGRFRAGLLRLMSISPSWPIRRRTQATLGKAARRAHPAQVVAELDGADTSTN